jgi:hypothetical protein
LALGRSHGFATLSRHGNSALDRVLLEERLWHISPQPRQSRFIRPAQVPGRTSAPRRSFYGRASAMQRSRFSIVLEVITTAAMVALVLYVLFPSN